MNGNAPMHTKTQLVVIQPTPFCNINCRYCYLPDRSVTHKISMATLTRIFESLFASSFLQDDVVVLWHTGEPTVLPVSFYEQAFQLIEKLNTQGVNITHSFQTNATLIDQVWCDFIRRYTVHIGVSIDGPAHIHDLNRVDRAGKGTFERTLRGIKLLQQNGITPSIIMVLTRYALDYPDEIWQFLREHHFTHVALLAEEVLVANRASTLETEQDIEHYKRFLKRILELRFQTEAPPFIREIDTILEHIEFLTSPALSLDTIPGAFLSFDYKGNISTFSSELLVTSPRPPYADFIFGNIHECEIEAIFSNQKFIEVHTQIQQGIARCRDTCDYFSLCGGGSPVHKLCEHHTFDASESLYCRIKIKATTDSIVDVLEQRYHIAD